MTIDAGKRALPPGAFLAALARWQERRPVWLLTGGAALFLELFSWLFFQTFLGLEPCELCVYIRFSMVGLGLGAAVTAVRPWNPCFKAAGLGVMVWALASGLVWNTRLELENLRAADPNWLSSCNRATVRFPFGLKLDEWLPSHFAPLSECGTDSAWAMLGLSMPEWLYLAYAGFALMIVALLVGWRAKATRRA